jgi:hypothetical protein
MAAGTPLPEEASWWLDYQLALLRRRLVEVRRDQCDEQHPGGPPDQSEMQQTLERILLQFETLQQSARNVGQRLAVMHQSAVVQSVLADLQRANDRVAARKRYETAEQLLLTARWLAVAHGENQGRRFAYGFRRLALILASLADVADSPKKANSLRSQAASELQHAMSLAKRHGFIRLQSQISRNIASLFPTGFESEIDACEIDT